MASVARLLLYVGALIAIGRGLLTLAGSDWRAGEQSVHSAAVPQWLARGAALLLVLAPLLMVQLQLSALDMTRADLPTLLGETGWGQGWSQLMTACVLASIALVLPVGGSTSLMLVFGTLAVAFAMSGLGHAAADEQWPLGARVLDATHILTTGAWIGGLLMTWSVTRVRGFATANEAWRRFSRVATVMAPLSIATGVLGAARVLRHASLGAAVSSDYGQLLLLKTALVVTVLAIGARQRTRIARGDLPAVRSVQVELGMALGVLLVTALFTGMEPPGE